MINSFAEAKASSCKSANQRQQSSSSSPLCGGKGSCYRSCYTIKLCIRVSQQQHVWYFCSDGRFNRSFSFWIWCTLYRFSFLQFCNIFLSKMIMKIDGGLKTDTRWVILPGIHRLYWMFFWETNPFTATPGNHLKHFKGRYFRGKRRFFVMVERSIFVLSKTTETLKIQVWEQAQDLH